MNATASCTAPSVLVGGGWISDNTTATSFNVYDSFPSTPGVGGTWTVTIGSSSGFTMTAYALCSP